MEYKIPRYIGMHRRYFPLRTKTKPALSNTYASNMSRLLTVVSHGWLAIGPCYRYCGISCDLVNVLFVGTLQIIIDDQNMFPSIYYFRFIKHCSVYICIFQIGGKNVDLKKMLILLQDLNFEGNICINVNAVCFAKTNTSEVYIIGDRLVYAC